MSVWVWRGLEVKVVLPVAVELGGGYIHPDHNFICEPGLVYGSLYQLKSCGDVIEKPTEQNSRSIH